MQRLGYSRGVRYVHRPTSIYAADNCDVVYITLHLCRRNWNSNYAKKRTKGTNVLSSGRPYHWSIA
jgi:hypothetical protein